MPTANPNNFRQSCTDQNCGNCANYSLDGVHTSQVYASTPCAVDAWQTKKDAGIKDRFAKYVCDKFKRMI